MSTLHQLRDGLTDVWDNVIDGWQRLYRRASSAISRFTPGANAREALEEAGSEIGMHNAGWGVLAAEVFDNSDQILVRLETPGLEKSDFDVEVLGNYLVVRGEKHHQRERSAGRYFVTECAYGSFERAIPLPDEVDSSKARARYKNGVLRIELPKAGSAHRRSITVDVH